MNILLLHASAGAGHKRAAQALEKAFTRLRPDARIRVADILDFTPPLFRQTYAHGYLDLVRKAPELWGYLYAQADRAAPTPFHRRLRTLFNRVNTPAFTRFLAEAAPDLAVCTHFMPLEILASRRGTDAGRPALFGVVTDYAVHSLWILDRVDGYAVATEEARRQLLRAGRPAGSVTVTGIPVDPVFETSAAPASARRALGLEPDRPAVLLLSGGCGVGPAVELIRAVAAARPGYRLLVVAGANRDLQAQAEGAAREAGIEARVYGFVDHIYQLMDAADLIVTKPGGLTVSEALAKGKPLLLIDPIPGQEQRNGEWLLEAGAAARLFDVADAGHKIGELLGDPDRLARMAAHARRLGHPHAALDIATWCLRRIAEPA